MPPTLTDIIRELEGLAAYDGPWRPLRDEAPLLRQRVDELRERDQRLGDVLVIALVGGSGVGKSTLINAIAGDELAEASAFRPCTSVPTVYQPPGVQLGFDDWNIVTGSALEHVVIIDTPDSDTVVKEHRARVQEALLKTDLVLICGSGEKYLDEATWSLLRDLKEQRAMACVETKADQGESVREHWLGRLEEQGFQVDAYFRVNARRTFDRKVSGGEAGPDEFDFPKLEAFLRDELSRERIHRIKKSNAAGLLRMTIARLDEAVTPKTGQLDALEAEIKDAEAACSQEVFELVRGRLFAEPHLWNYALGREIGVRAKGIMGTVYRLVEAIRGLPARMASWLPGIGSAGAGHHAAALLADKEAFREDFDLVGRDLETLFSHKQSALDLDFAKAGFDLEEDPRAFSHYAAAIQQQIDRVLRGPARERIIKRARMMTSWPVTILFDAGPIAFIVFFCYNALRGYFTTLMPTAWFLNSITVLVIILFGELFVMSLIARTLAWNARRGAVRDLRVALAASGAAFARERKALAQTKTLLARLDELKKAL